MTLLLEIALTNAVMATAIGVVAAVVGRVCRRPALSHCLWLLVLLKLITPPLILLPIPSVMTSSVGLGPKPTANGSPSRDRLGPIGQTRDIRPPAVTSVDRSAGEAPQPQETSGHPVTGAAKWETITALVPWVWLAGSATWFAVAGIRIRRFQRFLRHATPAASGLQERARELAGRLGVTRCPRVCVVPLPISPLLWGISPAARLVLPADLLRCLEPDEQDVILAHELAHHQRHDNWVRLLELATIGLYWWHPLVWWARREIGRAEEYCCDSCVVWLLPGAALAYAKALLKTVEFLSEARPILIPATSGAGRLPFVKNRVAMILNESRCHRLSRPDAAAALLIAVCSLTVAPGRPAALGGDVLTREKESALQSQSSEKRNPPPATTLERTSPSAGPVPHLSNETAFRAANEPTGMHVEKTERTHSQRITAAFPVSVSITVPKSVPIRMLIGSPNQIEAVVH